jgi:isopenicillin N synthase-like dioxygenase
MIDQHNRSTSLTGNDSRSPQTREAVKSIATIDISPFVSDGGVAERKKTAQQLRKACIDVGFFYLSGHGIPADELEQAIAWARKFFELPLDVKLRYRSTEPAEAGFVRIGGINPGANVERTADLKERFVLAREMTPTEAPNSIGAKSLSRWPGDDVLPGFAMFMKKHLAKRIALSQAMTRAFALSLDLPETYFDGYFRKMAIVSLINYYPPLDADAVRRNQWSFSAHTDYGAFTLLSQDSLGGLQVQNATGEWIEVPPIDGTFVVNLGDLMAMWTNDLYTSTLHRAANISGLARISIPFFASPYGDAEIRCIETCQGPDNPSRYQPVLAGEYIRSLIARHDASGKPGVSVETAKRLGQG